MTRREKEMQVPLSFPIEILTEIPSNCKPIRKLKKLFIDLLQLDEFKEYSLFVSKEYFIPAILEIMIEKDITFKEAEEICRKRSYESSYYSITLNMKDNYTRNLMKKALVEEMKQLKENKNVISCYLPNVTIDMWQVLEESILLDMTRELEEDLEFRHLLKINLVEKLQKELQYAFEKIMKKSDLNEYDKTILTESLESMQADVEMMYFSNPLGFLISEVIKNAIERDIKFSEAKAYINLEVQKDDYVEKICKNTAFIEHYKRVFENFFESIYEYLKNRI